MAYSSGRKEAIGLEANPFKPKRKVRNASKSVLAHTDMKGQFRWKRY